MNRYFSILILLLLQSHHCFTQGIDSLTKSGNTLRESGLSELAIAEYQKALAIDKESSVVNYEMAFTYFTINNFRNTIKFCNRIISSKSEKTIEAYILKGSALDYMGKSKKSIRLYNQAIKLYPNNYLLHYNLGITYHNRNKLAEAEVQYLRSIEIDKLQPSSHYMLGVLMNGRGERVKSMLSLYFFLLLEPNTERSTEAYKLLQKQWKQNIEINPSTPNTFKIKYTPNEVRDFNAIDLAISSIYIKNSGRIRKTLNAYESMISNTTSLFSVIGDYKSTIDKGLWTDFYSTFFNDLVIANQVEPFYYYISSTCDDIIINSWLESNKEKIVLFSNWVNNRLLEK